MESTGVIGVILCILGLERDYIGYILGFYWDNGKENGNYYSILGLHRDSGKEYGSNYLVVNGWRWGFCNKHRYREVHG